MGELDRLREERDKLLNQRKKIKTTKRISTQKRSLQREIRDLKNPKTTFIKKGAKKGLILAGKGTFKVLEKITRPTKKGRRKKISLI